MTLADLLATTPDLSSLRSLALILSPSLHAILTAAQAALPAGRQNRVQPQPLSDGRFMLCADILSEVQPGGLYAEGFGRLPASAFPLVEVLPIAEALALRPPAEEMTP
jgi:hypothetical protein